MPLKNNSTKKSAKKNPSKKSPIMKLKDEIQSLKSEVNLQKDKYLRLKAEFDNYRRRKERETVDLLKYDGETVIKRFITVLDDLDRLEKASADKGKMNKEKLHEGIELILNKIKKQFDEIGIKAFTNTGEILDPELHDALMTRLEDGKAENEILEVFEKGYRYKDRVIRHAKVVVNETLP